MESGEEQHFLRGKPGFRAWTLFQAPQTGNALSPIYVFHQVPCKHKRRKTGMRLHGCGEADYSQTNQPKHIGTQLQLSSPTVYQRDLSHEEAARRWHKEGQTPYKFHSTDLLLLLSQSFSPQPVNTGDTRDLKRKLGEDSLLLSVSPSCRLPFTCS